MFTQGILLEEALGTVWWKEAHSFKQIDLQK